MSTRSALAAKAIEVLRENDRGSYTVPTKGLYPFQWNWDSCFTALGQSHYDMDRAWTEVETLFAHQWADGMVPHMVFHEPAPTYFPGMIEQFCRMVVPELQRRGVFRKEYAGRTLRENLLGRELT